VVFHCLRSLSFSFWYIAAFAFEYLGNGAAVSMPIRSPLEAIAVHKEAHL
jgi:hypothetical protein